jgi:tetratricopeptide (TPR) repeat protein
MKGPVRIMKCPFRIVDTFLGILNYFETALVPNNRGEVTFISGYSLLTLLSIFKKLSVFMSRRSKSKAFRRKSAAVRYNASVPQVSDLSVPDSWRHTKASTIPLSQATKNIGPSHSWRRWVWGLLLVVVTILAYQPAWNGKPIWDDEGHITKPELRSMDGLGRVWIKPGATQQYYPLAHSVFWVEHKIWGDSPLGYHLINILLHAVSALLLLKMLRRLEVPGAFLATVIFALHPVQVESVAWISELKNTLSGTLYLGSALAYLEFYREGKKAFYAAALGLFVLGLMAKTVIATLPAALLLVFWWKSGSLSWKRDVLPLIPFFITGIAFGLFTAWVEQKFVGAEGSVFEVSSIERLLIAGRAFWFYLDKLLWPANLIFIYPRWNVSEWVWWQYLFPAAAFLLLTALWVWHRRGTLMGLLFFAVTLFPALGFFNVYPFRFSYVADHFQYLASIGPIALAGAGINPALDFLRKRNPFLTAVICGTLISTLGVLTWRQCGMYSDVETLFRTTIERNPECWMAYSNLGVALLQKGQVDEAIASYQKSLEIKPDYADAHGNLGTALLQKGQVDEAIAHYQKALEIQPQKADAHSNLGNAFLQKGQVDEAIAHCQKALEITPDYADAHSNLGNAFLQKEQVDAAITHYQKALQIKPDFSEALYNLGNAFLKKGQVDAAITYYQKALQIKPDFSEAYGNLGNAFLQKRQVNDAIAHYQRALEIKPLNVVFENNLALVLAASPTTSLRNGIKAVVLAQQANQLSGGSQPLVLRTLAAAYAEAKRFPEAVETAQRALKLAKDQGNAVLGETIESNLKLYQSDTPLRIPRLMNASQ